MLRLKEYEMIMIVKEFIPHITYKEISAFDGGTWHEPTYTDLKIDKFNKLKQDYEEIEADMKAIKERRAEIDILLQSELLSDNKRDMLINEYNDLGMKYLGDSTRSLYEALDLSLYIHSIVTEIIVELEMTVEELFRRQFSCFEVKPFTMRDIDYLITKIKKCIKATNYNFDIVHIVLSAYILSAYEKIWNRYYTTFKNANILYGALEEYMNNIKNPHLFLWNLYSVFRHMLEGIDIDELIQNYPIEKRFEEDGWKNYYSSIEAIEKIKAEYGNIITDKSSSLLLMEVEFSEKIVWLLGLKMISVMEYDTGINGWELMIDFFDNYDTYAKEQRKKNFKIIK